MKVRIPNNGGMADMLRKAQQVQEEMAAKQIELEGREYEISAGGGAVTVKINGKREILDIRLSEEVIDPDDPDHFFLGRVAIKPDAHDQVHAEFTMEAVCEPWRYALMETKRRVEVDGTAPVDVVIRNNGVKTLCPDIEVEGSVTLTHNGASVTLTTGVYKITDIKLRQGFNVVGVTGNGSVEFRYREATL